MRDLIELGTRTYESWRDDRTLRLGAGLAYYALFTLVPFIAITLALAEPLVGQADLESFLAERLDSLGVDEPGGLADDVAAELSGTRTKTSLGLIGAASLLFSASLVFGALRDAMNSIWGIPVASGWRNTIRKRAIGFAMVLVSSLAIVFSLATNAIVSAAEAIVPGELAILESIAPLLSSGLSWAGLWILAALLFRYLAPSPLPWRGSLAVGAITAVLLVLSSIVMGWYLREYGGDSVPGAFGAIFALLTWVYVEAQIVLGGVQLTKAIYPSEVLAVDLGDPE